jgi:hypothetical protein
MCRMLRCSLKLTLTESMQSRADLRNVSLGNLHKRQIGTYSNRLMRRESWFPGRILGRLGKIGDAKLVSAVR